jgi:hypothetical protein
MTILVGLDTGASGSNDMAGGGQVRSNDTFGAGVYTGQTAVASGTATSVKIKLKSGQAGGRKLQCAVWSSGSATPTLLGQTVEYTTTGSEVDGNFATLNLVTPFAITSGTAYILSAWANNYILVYETAAGDSQRYNVIAYAANDWSGIVPGSGGSAGTPYIVMYVDGTTGSSVNRESTRRGAARGVLRGV